MSRIPVWYENPSEDLAILSTSVQADNCDYPKISVVDTPLSVEPISRTRSNSIAKNTGKENNDSDRHCAKRKADNVRRGEATICRSDAAEKSSSRRRVGDHQKTCPIENLLRHGVTENLTKLQEGLTKYESGASGFGAQSGLFILYDPCTEAGKSLYLWLQQLGFGCSPYNEDPVLFLPSSKVSALKVAMSKHRAPSDSKMTSAFFSASQCTSEPPTPSTSSSAKSRPTSSKHRSAKKPPGSACTRAQRRVLQEHKRRVLQEHKSSNIMEGGGGGGGDAREGRDVVGYDDQSVGDVSLSLCMNDADVAFQCALSLAPQSRLPPPTCKSSTVLAAVKTFGGASKQHKSFSISSFGVGVTVAPPKEEEMPVLVLQADKLEARLGVAVAVSVEVVSAAEAGDAVARRPSAPLASLLQRREGKERKEKRLLVDLDVDSGDDLFDDARPLSTSVLACSSSSSHCSASLLLASLPPQRPRSATYAGVRRSLTRKAPRRRLETPSPDSAWSSDAPDSVTKGLNNMAISSSLKKKKGPGFSSLDRPPPPPAVSSGLDSTELFSHPLDDLTLMEGEDKDEVLLVRPSPNISLDLSDEEHGVIGEKESSVMECGGRGVARLMNFLSDGGLSDGALSDSSSGFSPHYSVSRPPRAPSLPPPPEVCHRYTSIDDDEGDDDDDELQQGPGGTEADAEIDKKFYWEDDMYRRGHDVVPPNRRLRRSKTDPLQSMAPPQTPDVSQFLSQATSSKRSSKIFETFSTPTTAVTSHVSGHAGADYLLTTVALPIELKAFWEALERRVVRAAVVVRDSSSPHLFSALSNRVSLSCSDEREVARGKKNKAFLKRMSGSCHEIATVAGSSFNPSTASKLKRDRKSVISNEVIVNNADSKVHWGDLDLQGGHCSLDKSSFRGVVIGGTYEHCFDDNVPVVSAPSVYDKRVVGVQLIHSDAPAGTGEQQNHHQSTSLRVFLVTSSSRAKNPIQTVTLGPRWVCYKISTGGFLVAASEIMPHVPCKCYFLPKHPTKWAVAMKNMSPKHSSFGLTSLGGGDDSMLGGDSVDDYEYYEAGGGSGRRSSSSSSSHIISSIEHFAADESKIFPEEEEDEDEDEEEHFQYTQQLYRSMCDEGARARQGGAIPKLRFGSSDEEDESSLSLEREGQAMMRGDAEEEEEDGVVFLGMTAADLSDDDPLELDMSINALRLHDDDECDDDDDVCGGVDWNNSVVLSNVLAFLSGSEEIRPGAHWRGLDALLLVSKSWALEVFKVRAAALSQPGACQHLDSSGWVRFMHEYGDGKFLSAGACKDVFCVYPQSGSRLPPAAAGGGAGGSSSAVECLQAVSVMDMEDLRARDVADSIARELEISMLCSTLVSLNICPNLLQVYSIFQADFPPCCSMWQRGKGTEFPSRAPRLTEGAVKRAMGKLQRGEFQYIRMEFCSSGDLEEVVRARSCFEPLAIRSLFFQMCFSLYCCREQLSLRHYDVKLLNFFSTGPESLLPVAHTSPGGAAALEGSGLQLDDSHLVDCDCEEEECQFIEVGFGEHVYSLPLRGGGAQAGASQSMVKLADFGTSCVGSSSLSLPITVHQFTTLENTPPEYLFLGSHARECFSADTFGLGLCFLHLLAGDEPYEEHLKSVRCPLYLKGRLHKLWRTSDQKNQYNVIAKVIASLDGDDCCNVLYDTFYRYLVLLELNTTFSSDEDSEDVSGCEEDSAAYPSSNPVLCAAVDCLGLDADRCRAPPSRQKRECMQQFHQDRAVWSLKSGTGDVVQRVRSHLQLLGEGSAELLASMLDLDASKRCSLHEAIGSPLFFALRVPASSGSVSQDDSMAAGDSPRGGRSFMHYKDKQFLPIF